MKIMHPSRNLWICLVGMYITRILAQCSKEGTFSVFTFFQAPKDNTKHILWDGASSKWVISNPKFFNLDYRQLKKKVFLKIYFWKRLWLMNIKNSQTSLADLYNYFQMGGKTTKTKKIRKSCNQDYLWRLYLW